MAARLHQGGLGLQRAAQVAVVEALSDDEVTLDALREVVLAVVP